MQQGLIQFGDWLLPRVCISCGFASENSELDLCRACKHNLPWLDNRCYQCGAPLLLESEAHKCEKCLSSPPPFNRLCALFQYKPPLIKLINSLKFGRQLYPAPVLGYLLAEAVMHKWYLNIPKPELIIPVPLHLYRQRQRGYNQALELCLPLAKYLNIPLGLDICARNRFTSAQARLKRSSRIKNLSAAFSVTENINYKYIALVDDVVTTGSTVRAVSQVLLAAGVESIDVWSICR